MQVKTLRELVETLREEPMEDRWSVLEHVVELGAGDTEFDSPVTLHICRHEDIGASR